MIWLKDADDSMGGKAYGLSQLIKAEINVPDGFVIPNNEIIKILENDQNVMAELKDKLSAFSENSLFAVRSSACAEDGAENSYAGMFESKLNVKNAVQAVVSAVKYVNCSAESLRVSEYSGGVQQKMNIVVQQMVNPRIAGVAFSKAIDIDGTEVILIECVEGLADKLVAGKVVASRITVPAVNSGKTSDKISYYGTPINCEGIDILINNIRNVAKYFHNDMDIEWCIDENNHVFLVQARPITKIPIIDKVSSEGIIASHGYAIGTAVVIDEELDDSELLKQISEFPQNAVLIAATTDTQYLPAMKKACGIITEEGSALSHAAIVSRELNIPCIAGYKNARKLFVTGGELILDANNGVIQYNSTTYTLTREKSFNFADVYNFEKIEEFLIDGKQVLFQPTFDGMAVYLPDEITLKESEKIELFCRRNFGVQPVHCTNEKYAWYFEYRRFFKLPYFSDICQFVKELCTSFNESRIESFYKGFVDILKEIVLKKEMVNYYDRIVLEEICMAYHFVLDMLLPNGYAIQNIYFHTLPILDKYGYTLNDLLNGTYQDFKRVSNKDKEVLKVAYNFIEKVGHCRNTICEKLVSVGAMSYDYFEHREDRISEALKTREIIQSGENIVDLFYHSLTLSEKVISISSYIGTLLI